MLKALLTDVDGTLTDPSRRINTAAIESIRVLLERGVEVVPASGNTACFMDALCKMLGTRGTFIAENGGVFRVGYTGTLHVKGDQAVCKKALEIVQSHYRKRGIELELYSPSYRFADIAFARTVPVSEVTTLLTGHPIHMVHPHIWIRMRDRLHSICFTIRRFRRKSWNNCLSIGECNYLLTHCR